MKQKTISLLLLVALTCSAQTQKGVLGSRTVTGNQATLYANAGSTGTAHVTSPNV